MTIKNKTKKIINSESGIYFTRLTPNSENWRKPTGVDGKCSSAKLYEAEYGFGWEEWLFEEYYLNLNDPNYRCKGFIQAFNKKNKSRKIQRLYLYTKECNSKNPAAFSCYYVGYIENIEVIDSMARPKSEVEPTLSQAGITHDKYNCMLKHAYNIKFSVKDVHIIKKIDPECTIKLNKGQVRFALYDIHSHQNFIKELESLKLKKCENV